MTEKGLGITVKPEDANALCEAILRLLSDRDLRLKMGEKGRGYVERERNWKNVTQRTQDIMRALLS